MISKALASLAYETGQRIGDTSSIFLTKIKTYLNDRYSDFQMRVGSTMWCLASTGALGDSDVPMLGAGEVIKLGALADGWEDKRHMNKGAKYNMDYERKLADFIISGQFTQFNISVYRYTAHEN